MVPEGGIPLLSRFNFLYIFFEGVEIFICFVFNRRLNAGHAISQKQVQTGEKNVSTCKSIVPSMPPLQRRSHTHTNLDHQQFFMGRKYA